jgi:Bucentaur or craniofacial development
MPARRTAKATVVVCLQPRLKFKQGKQQAGRAMATDESPADDSTAQPLIEQQEEERQLPDALPAIADDDDAKGSSPLVSTLSQSQYLLSKVQMQAVDSAFERMFGYPWGTHFELPTVLNHEQRMLVNIFGPEAASCLIGMLPRNRRSKAPALRTNRRPAGKATIAKGQSRPIVEVAKPPLAPAKVVDQERGKATTPPQSSPVEVPTEARPTATVPVPPAPQQSRGGGGGGVDRLLSEISGKASVSTLSKTSTDWESFKATSGLGDAIEEKAQSKDSFLNRQDFLQRVDHRTFEVEKQERDRERAQRGK